MLFMLLIWVVPSRSGAAYPPNEQWQQGCEDGEDCEGHSGQEIRNPNIETRNKFKMRKWESGKLRGALFVFFRYLNFPICFGFRISVFGFRFLISWSVARAA